MKKVGLMVMLALTIVVFSGTAFAVKPDNGSPYANQIVVAKSGGDFTDLRIALDSITDASAANPYLVTIMPGIYDLGTDYLYMKEFVDIEGSGQGNTILTGSPHGPLFYTAPGTTLSNLAIQTTNSWIGWTECARMKDQSKLDSISCSGYATGSFAGIVIDGANPTSVDINNVTITNDEGGTPTNQIVGIHITGPHEVNMNNVSISLSGGAQWVKGVTFDNWSPGYLNVNIINSIIDVHTADDLVMGLEARGIGDAKIVNSRIYAADGSNTIGLSSISGAGGVGLGRHQVMNSEIHSTSSQGYIRGIASNSSSETYKLRVSNTLIEGTLFLNGIQPSMINCFDQDFNLIPNQ